MLKDSTDENSIAIIGMSCRLPRSSTYKLLWENLISGRNLVTFFSSEELAANGVSSSLLANKNYVKAKGIIENTEYFDAEFFGIPARDAVLIDPQQRILLECAWEALEDAGYSSEFYEKLVGVFVGCNAGSYYLNNVAPLTTSEQQDLIILTGNSNDYLATRISHLLDLKGPSLTIQTACSTSLVAVHTACQYLLNNQCDIAIAGGVSITLPLKAGYLHTNDSIYSSDGYCRAFDAKADGTVFSDGAGIVVLKKLQDALKDGDSIRAIIKGSATNNDGKAKVSYTAPSVQGQAEAIALAYHNAGISPETVGYIEAHGTGTLIGDPIEVKALTQVFQLYTAQKQYCALGSIKTNLGHLITAAGIAGLIKTVLAIQHRIIPANLNFNCPNSKIDFLKTPFYVNKKNIAWSSNDPLRAGVSSFGIGGTNTHVVLEESPQLKNLPFKSNKIYLLPFSANGEASIKSYLNEFNQYLRETKDDLANISFTLQVGRKSFPYRKALLCNSIEEAQGKLGNIFLESMPKCITSSMSYEQVWLFQNNININNFQEIIKSSSLFMHMLAETLESCQDFKGYVYSKLNAASQKIEGSENFIKFILQFTIGKALIKIGIKPSMVVAIGIGSLAAITLTEIIDFDVALKLAINLDNIINQQEPIFLVENFNIKKSKVPISLPEMINFLNLNKLFTSSDFWRDLLMNEEYPNDFKNTLIKPSQNKKLILVCGYNNNDFHDISPYNIGQKNDIYFDFLEIIKNYWELGYLVNWNMLNSAAQNRIPLPTYSFDKKKYWMDHQIKSDLTITSNDSSSSLPNTSKVEKYSYGNHGNLIKKIIAVIWNEILQLEHIKDEDSFFILGGDSMHGLEIIGKINSLFHINVRLEELFQNSTLLDFSRIIEKKLLSGL